MKIKLTPREANNIMENVPLKEYSMLNMGQLTLFRDWGKDGLIKAIYRNIDGEDYLIEKEPDILCPIIIKLGLCPLNGISVNRCCCYTGVKKK